jgi:hypothetical protein
LIPNNSVWNREFAKPLYWLKPVPGFESPSPPDFNVTTSSDELAGFLRETLLRDSRTSEPLGFSRLSASTRSAGKTGSIQDEIISAPRTVKKSPSRRRWAHLNFVTIHPLEDVNGRIARAITEMSLARLENSSQRFYSMSSQIREERKAYYEILEATQKVEWMSRNGWSGF